MRSNLRNRHKRIEKLGPVRHEVLRGGAEIEQALEDGFRIEAAAWKGNAGTAIDSSPATRRFYQLFAEGAAARGWLELHFLTVGDRRVAFAYCLRYGRILYLQKQGYDPELSALAPAALLFERMVAGCFEQGLEALDLLGRDEEWKLNWTSETRPHHWWFGFSPSLRSRLFRTLKFTVVPALRDGPLGPLLQRAAAAE